MTTYAIRIGGKWFLAKKARAESYGQPRERGLDVAPETEVWCDINTTGLLGLVGDEKVCVDLAALETE